MKFLTTFKINKGFDRWLKLVDELQPYMEKYEYKMMFACTNDEETRVWDMGEANNAELVTDFLNDQEVINMRIGYRFPQRPRSYKYENGSRCRLRKQ